MPLAYDNSGTPFYSEADRVFDEPQDWTAGGADSVRLFVRGNATNAAEALYVRLEDSAGRSASVSHADPDVALATEWQSWTILLTEFGQVNAAAIEKVSVGVGNRTSPAAGGTGTIYVDDIGFGRAPVGQ